MDKILKNDEKDNLLEQEGYVVIPFLNKEQVQVLIDVYNETHPVAPEGLYATAHSGDKAFKQMMNDKILEAFSPAIRDAFIDCRPLGGSYIVKYKGEKGVLFPHQDWNITDEDLHRSFNIWVPLVDTNEQNGALAVLPRSHKLIKSYRGVNIPDPFYKINDYTRKYHTTVPMKAGEALIYDHRLLHASGINATDAARLAVVFGIIPEKAAMRYYYMNEGKVEEFESSVDFFFDHDILKGPQGLRKIKEIVYDLPILTVDQFDELYLGKKPIPVEEASQPLIPETNQNFVEAAEVNKPLLKRVAEWFDWLS
jgi:hypothetical protein